MKAKLLEVRDRCTFIPVLAVSCVPTSDGGFDAQLYLLRRAGYDVNREHPTILLTPLGGDRPARCDPYGWGDRTMQAAHLYIEERWDELRDGDVVDARVQLGEATEPARSERFGG